MALEGSRFVKIDPEELKNRDLIVVAPTGSGKTTNVLRAVAKLVPRVYRRAVILAPTRALMYELEKKLRDILRESKGPAGEKLVGVDNSDAKLDPSWRFSEVWSKPFVITSYERFDALVTRDPSILKDTIVVIDEAHNLLQPQRATALIDILANAKMVRDRGSRVRLVLLSATMPEVESLKKYLDAKLIVHNARPVELKIERVPVQVYGRGTRIYYLTKLSAIIEALKKYPKPALVYVPSRAMSEQLAEILSKHGFRAVPYHAGMPYQERKRIQEEMRKKNPSIDVVVATDTLSQGVNMSFRTVIIPGLKRFMKGGFEYVDPATIRQVMGRAGRPEYGYNEGYVVIIETPDEAEIVEKALRNEYGSVREPGDYIGLVLRLLATGRRPEVWAKYAYKVDSDKMEAAVRLLKNLGLINENEELDPLARILALDYVDGTALPVFYTIRLLERSSGRYTDELKSLDPVTRAFLYSASAAYYMNRGWTRRRELESKIGMGVGIDTSILSEVPMYKLNNAVYEQLGVDEEGGDTTTKIADLLTDILNFVDPNAPNDFTAPEGYIVALANPQAINIDNDVEALRKAASVIIDLSKAGQLPRELGEGAIIVEAIARSYRRLMREVKPHESKTYLPAILRAVKRILAENPDVNANIIAGVISDAAIVYEALVKARKEAPSIDEAAEKIYEILKMRIRSREWSGTRNSRGRKWGRENKWQLNA